MGTRALIRGVHQCKCLSEGDRQGHPDVHHKWSRLPTCAAQHPGGVFEPDSRKEGQNNRGRKEGEGAKDGPAHPQHPLSSPRTSKRPLPHLDSSCVVEDVKEILQ